MKSALSFLLLLFVFKYSSNEILGPPLIGCMSIPLIDPVPDAGVDVDFDFDDGVAEKL